MGIGTIFQNLNETLDHCQATLGLRAWGQVELYTNDVEGVLVADDASLVSLIALDGSLRLMGELEFNDFVERLNTVLQVTLNKSCHSLQFVFQYDPKRSQLEASRHFQPIRLAAKGLELDLEDVLTDWEQKLGSYCADERAYLAIWTRPTAINQAELKRERKKLAESNLPASPLVQGKNIAIERLREIHLAQVRQIIDFFNEQRFKIKWLNSHEAVSEIRRILVPELTASDWRPTFMEDLRWPMVPSPESSPYDQSYLLPPILARQIWPSSAHIVNRRFVMVGQRLYAPFVLTLPPQNLLPFNKLLQALRGDLPWRAAILLSGEGLRQMSLKSLLAQILAFTANSNKMFTNAYKALEAEALAGTCLVSLQASFVTWVDLDNPKEALQDLTARSCTFQTQVQAWGSCETTDLLGDPLKGLAATIPAIATTSLAPKALAPLHEALRLLPLARPASAWNNCDLPLRSPDGKFLPVGLFHSAQASWNEVCFAGMGAGKSFFLNTLNFFFLLRPGQARLPWLTVIDVGPSCSGVINLIKWALPVDKQHLAVFVKLKNAPEYSINPFDTPLGCPYPLRNHWDFLNNLLQLLCTPDDKSVPVDGVASLLREACDQLYKRLAPNGSSPKAFDPYLDGEVTHALQDLGFTFDDKTTWWEVVEFLFDLGQYVLATRAQRFAMPVIADLASLITEANISENYQKILAGGGGENVPHACSRYLIAAIKSWPILANPTRFTLGTAQIIGFDLQEVTPRGGALAERQSGIMYMLARFVGAGHFFNTLDDLDQVPPKYQSYHRPRFESLVSDPKRLCYDEFHRASCQDMNNPLSKQIISDLTTASRESRKLNLSIGLYSQRLSDFPSEIVAMATSIYALGAGNESEAAEISERFGLNQAAYEALRQITRPGPKGANFIALYRTDQGECLQILTNSAGSIARWAFSTTAEDMRLRNALYDRLGCRKALALLQKYYPAGSVKPELERRKAKLGDNYDSWQMDDLELKLLEELLAKADDMA